jgi:outer membrane protein OmpA-like peptidoglycan-associated protein/uncharacterized membrane protein (UPF0127 family)
MTFIVPDAQASQLLTHSGSHPLRVRRAASFFSRFAGLMLRRGLAPDAALLLADCPSVHTAFMRFTIDVVYLDRDGVVLKCVPQLRPWRLSASNAGRDAAGRRHRRAAHTLELAAGSIARWDIRPGDRLQQPLWFAAGRAAPQGGATASASAARARQRGAAIVELAVVAPILTILGLGSVQYSQLFFAKNQINHAAMLAARAGSVGNASMSAIKQAFTEGLVPMYGGGQDAATLATSLAAATEAVNQHSSVEMLNPTKEAFQDFNDPALQTLLDTKGKRVISNRSLAFKPTTVGAASGETIQDANLIKLRITHGVKPAVPIIASIYKVYLKWQDTGGDPVRTKLIDDGLVPVVSHVTLQMQSDAIEPDNPVSSPGAGNGGNPVNPGDPPVTTDPPPSDCGTLGGCSTPPPGTGNMCPIPIATTLNADTLFGFDQALLQPDGIKALDQLIASTHGQAYDTLTVTGYTDPIGTDAYNLDLSRRRAEAVRDYLLAHGLKVDHVNVIGAGATDLIVPPEACEGKSGTALQTCYADDRRVVVQLKPKS